MDEKMFSVEEVLEVFKKEVPAEDREIIIDDSVSDSFVIILKSKKNPTVVRTIESQNKSGARAFYEMFVMLNKMGLLLCVKFLDKKNGENP